MTTYSCPGVYAEEKQDFYLNIKHSATAVPAFLCTADDAFTFAKKCGNQDPDITDYARIPSWVYIAKQLERVEAENSGETVNEAIVLSLKAYFENGGGLCYVVKNSGAIKKLPTVTLFVAAGSADEEVFQYCCENKNIFGLLDSHCGDGKFAGEDKILEIMVDLSQKIEDAGKSLKSAVGSIIKFEEQMSAHKNPADAAPNSTVGRRRFKSTEVGRARQALRRIGEDRALVEKHMQDAGTAATEAVKAFAEKNYAAAAHVVDQIIKSIRHASFLVDHIPLAAAQMESLSGMTQTQFNASLISVADAIKHVRNAVSEAEAAAEPAEKILYEVGEDSDSCAAYMPALETRGGKSVPASAAMAGIYCRVDRERGVWKAPANVEVRGELTVSKHVTKEGIGSLNTGANPVNVIRSVSGQAPVVWGARTLRGLNHVEFRYIPVRRLFNSVEKDITAALTTAVYEANSFATWERVRGAIDNYLYEIWQKGALVGGTPEEAYMVQVGLGVTMTQKDVAAGRMVIRVALAPARPAEFVILHFSQKIGSE